MTIEYDEEYVTKFYRCKVCKKSHEVQLNKNLIEGRSKFPFPHIIQHSEVINGGLLSEFMVMLYLDKDLQIRGTESLIGNNDFFSREQVEEITGQLLKEIEALRQDNLDLLERINKKNGN